MMWKQLHADLLTSILLKLPIKTIINCSLVCKTWYNFITSPTFITTHHNFKNTQPLLQITCCKERFQPKEFALHYCNETFDLHSKFEFPLRSSSKGSFHVIGCCNGLICISDGYTCNKDKIILWNPSIKKAVYLPEPIYVHPVQYLSPLPSLGFGFDFPKCDYKLVKVTHVDLNAVFPKVQIYRLSTRTWEDISHVAPRCYIVPASVGSFVHGAVHWIGWDWGYKYMIVSFDMQTEEFREMELPSSLAKPDAWKDNLVFDCEGSIGLVHENGDRSDIWVMEEYGVPESWIRRCSIDKSRRRPSWRSLVFRNINISAMVCHPCCVSHYTESLALLDSGVNIIIYKRK